MSNLSLTFQDSATMLRRDIKHSLRYLTMTLSGILTPTVMLTLFVYVFGNSIKGSLGGTTTYINYVAPAIIIMTICSGCATTAINLCMDLNEGIITRFRTMAISRASVLTGQVIGSLLRTLASVILVTLVALLMGFRPSASPLAWLEALGLIALFTFAITWIAVVFGIIGKTPAGANSLSLIFQLLLPFTSSAFIRTETLPVGIRWFSENQPITPIINTMRGLLLGTPIGNSSIVAVIWCIVLALVAFFSAQTLWNRFSVK